MRPHQKCPEYPSKRVLRDPSGEPGVHAHAGKDVARPGFVMRCRAKTFMVRTPEEAELFK